VAIFSWWPWSQLFFYFFPITEIYFISQRPWGIKGGDMPFSFYSEKGGIQEAY
jgi:hypothetical protein